MYPLVRVLLLVAALSAGVVPTTALAADIPRLSGPVTDLTGALGDREGEVDEALDELLREHGVQLFVLFVETTDELTSTEFAAETARRNSLGADDALLVVAMGDRTDAIWVADGLDEISDRELDEIIAEDLEPSLREGDFAGAVIATADALGSASGTAIGPAPDHGDEPGGGSASGDGGGLAAILGIVLLVVGGTLVFRWVSGSLSRRRDAEERDRRTGRLAREANALLVATDDRIREADQEVGFVEAEYGAEEARPLRDAVAEARAELREAFAVRQRLDDAEPEDPPTRQAMLTEIVERSRRAGAALDREAERIRRLRDLQRDAPALLESLPARIAASEDRLPAAERTMERLQRLAEPAWAPVRGNIVEARKGLDGATAAVERGRASLAGADRRGAARAIRTAQEGIAGAVALLDAVDGLAVSVTEAEARAPDELRSAEADLAAAREALDLATPGAGHESALAAAESALVAARRAASADPPDPLATLRAATDAHARADQVLSAVRADADQRARFAAAVDAAIATAHADIDRAAAYIATRRGGVGRLARTRLAEAERQVETAETVREIEPARAMEAARRAERLADEAYAVARREFDEWDLGGPGGGVGGSDVAAVILGGILGGVLSGGGAGRGGWGGSPWGSPGPFGGGGRRGGWGGGFGGGGFGGFGGFGGGGFGGGRSRGGRW